MLALCFWYDKNMLPVVNIVSITLANRLLVWVTMSSGVPY